MPERKTVEHARADKRAGKSPSTQAGSFVKEEMDHIREGKHGARSSKQAIAIGLSKARRAGVKVAPPKKGSASEKTRHKAEHDNEAGQHHSSHGASHSSSRRSRASEGALKREGKSAASKPALSRHAHAAASHRSAAERSASARKAARTRARAHG